MNYNFPIPTEGYHFGEANIKKIEENYKARYIGYWCTKRPFGGWNEEPIDIFWVDNPNRELGHSNFLGVFRRGEEVYVTNGESAFEESITGLADNDGNVIVSRYRHDYVTLGEMMIDGGRDYTRCSGYGRFVDISINDKGEFVITDPNKNRSMAI